MIVAAVTTHLMFDHRSPDLLGADGVVNSAGQKCCIGMVSFVAFAV